MDIDMLNLRRAVRGDERAFETLIGPYLDTTYRLCLRMMGNEQDAADMAQEALVRAWRALGSYKGQSRFSTWLYRVTCNVCLDELRKRKNLRTQSLQELQEEGVELVDPGQTPEMAAERAQTRKELSEAIGKLSQEHRAALVLRDVHGLPYEEIAQILDVNLNTVKSRIGRARAALRAILLERRNFPAGRASKGAEGRDGK